MNKKREKFLAENSDIQVKNYIFGEIRADEFIYYPYKFYEKDILINGFILLPYLDGEWLEDKLFVNSLANAKFFVKWFNESHNANAVLIESD